MKIHHKKPYLACKEGEYNSLKNCELIISKEEKQCISNAIRTNNPTNIVEAMACDIARFWVNCYIVGVQIAKMRLDVDMGNTFRKYLENANIVYQKENEDNQ